MANWWDKMIGGMVNRENQYVGERYGVTGAGDRRATTAQRAAATGAAAPAPFRNMSTLIPENLETAGRMGGAYGGGLLGMTAPAPQDPTYAGMTQEELLAYILGGSGGGVDLSGYNTMLEDISGRESALGVRKGEQEAFLTALYDAAETRAEEDRAALAAAVEAQLASDSERRVAEMGVVREGDVNRAASATAAREALGAPTGPDLTSATVENVASGIAASGSVADRDARIRESIANQQLTREISSLTPMEQMAMMQLNRGYEDRLGALASERAAIQAQMAQARSSVRGPSPSEKMAALQFTGEMFAPAAGPQYELPGLNQGQAAIEQVYGRQVAADIAGIGDRILSSAVMSTIDPTKPAGVSELLKNIRSQDPAIDSYLNQNPGFAAMVVNYVVQAGKGY